jgi:hypothetical protein
MAAYPIIWKDSAEAHVYQVTPEEFLKAHRGAGHQETLDVDKMTGA